MNNRLDWESGTAPPDLASALVSITSRLVGSPDNATVLRLVTEVGTGLLGATATGVMLTGAGGALEVVAASDEPARFVELLQTSIDQGPCVDCIAAVELITAADLAAERDRWPDFVPAALEAGYRSVVAVPLRLDGAAVGGFNLLYDTATTLPRWQLDLAQVVSDLAVLALVQERGDRRADRLLEATVTALNDRVQLDHAVGLVAGTLAITPAEARAPVIGHATRHHLVLREVTRAITDGTLAPADLTA
ncbi:GAF domain-containing protein [Amycolatopsis sp. NBC_01488]|uniref:GAF domain-containing protein n=1 Tax=Amycolatopsis sp. NBC_01488 TaxID=2903563 RepID=UPI002E2BF3FC|nr:GAF domain-containing protein [Amycolatopsis sp. NBC_01488]